MSYTLQFSRTSLKDLERHRKTGDKAVIKKIEKLLNELKEHPTTGTGQPEKLKHNFSGLYSRRINRKHRLIYGINEPVVTVYVLNAWTQYGEK